MKPIRITKLATGYILHVNGVPVVKGDVKGMAIDRARAGLKVDKNFVPPTSTAPLLFDRAGDAVGIAHQVGRYMLGLGDFVSGYTELVGVSGNPAKWWTWVLKS